MSSKTFKNLKMGATVAAGAVGPQTFTAATTWISAMVPVKGAKQVTFNLKSTDSNATVAVSVNVGNSSDGVGTLTASSTGHTLVGSQTGRMDKGGNRYSAFASGKAIAHDFAQLSVTSHGTNAHTAFQVDVEVMYDGDADVLRVENGQGAVVPV